MTNNNRKKTKRDDDDSDDDSNPQKLVDGLVKITFEQSNFFIKE